MSNNPSFDSFYNRTLRFLSFRPRSEKEVRDYLKKKKAGKKNTEDVLKRLKEYKFIDDLEFAKWFIENRKKGRRVVNLELKQKGIDKETVDKASLEFNLEKKDNALINELIEKKWKVISKYPKEEAYRKLVGFLVRHGFDYDEVKDATKNLFKENKFDD